MFSTSGGPLSNAKSIALGTFLTTSIYVGPHTTILCWVPTTHIMLVPHHTFYVGPPPHILCWAPPHILCRAPITHFMSDPHHIFYVGPPPHVLCWAPTPYFRLGPPPHIQQQLQLVGIKCQASDVS
jgi:hypothetical protein